MNASPRSQRSLELQKYEVFEEIGHGGMATVYRGLDRRLGREVALKVIHPHLRDSAEVSRRFAAEARAVAKLRHPNIVEVYDVSAEDEREQYLVVELLRGCTLRKLLDDHGALPPEVAAALMLELTRALAHAHEAGVIHRDVKPENVLLEHRPKVTNAGVASAAPESDKDKDKDKDRERDSGANVSERSISAKELAPGDRVIVKLTDFGIAKLLDAQGVTSTGQVLGSPAHMAPEQIEGGDVDGRSDVFACGVLFYECIVGHLPFRGNNPAQVLRRVLDGTYPSAEREQSTVGKRWSAIVDKALGHKPEQRYASVTELSDAITAELARVDVIAHSSGAHATTSSQTARNAKAELEAWLDDPAGYAKAHGARMVKTLSSLAAAERKANDVLGAAADYNRALAYAPNDPVLLRVVSGMHRREQQKRMLLRASPVALVIVAGLVSFGVARTLKKTLPHVTTTALPSVEPPPSASAAVDVDAAAFGPNRPTNVALTPNTPRTNAPLPAPPLRPVHRQLFVDTLVPAFGVLATLDGANSQEAHEGAFVLLNDGNAHQLRFLCQQNLCEPRQIDVAPGTDDVHLGEIRMKIRDATLIVDGNPANHYAIKEFPQIACRSGQAVKLPMRRRDEEVEILEFETSRSLRAALTAGQTAHIAFVSN
jgi:serine/threonine-protein kinase